MNTYSAFIEFPDGTKEHIYSGLLNEDDAIDAIWYNEDILAKVKNGKVIKVIDEDWLGVKRVVAIFRGTKKQRMLSRV